MSRFYDVVVIGAGPAGIFTALELADVEIDSVFGDVQAVSNLVDRVFNIEDPFLVEIQHDLTIFGVIRNIAIGIHFFDGELQRLGNQIFYRGSKVDI